MITVEDRIACPICGGASRAWTVRGGREYARCRDCGAAHMTNPPGAEELDALYRDAVFTLPGNDQYYDDDATNLRAARERRNWVERTVECGRLLDIGCGCGHFLAVLDGDKWEATGVDVSPHAIGEARRRFGVRCEARRIEAMPVEWRGAFDVVTMWDVIEHLGDPSEALGHAAALLRTGGRLFLSTPDISSLAARVLGRRWHYLDPMQHLCLMSREALRQLSDRAGLRPARFGTFGRSYTIGYLTYRAAYCYAPRGLRWTAGIGGRLPRLLRDAAVPVRLGDIVAMEAIRADAAR